MKFMKIIYDTEKINHCYKKKNISYFATVAITVIQCMNKKQRVEPVRFCFKIKPH